MNSKYLFLVIFQLAILNCFAQLETVTTTGNTTTRGIRITGQVGIIAPSPSTAKELVLGNFTQTTAFTTDPRCFIGYKGALYPTPGSTTVEGSLFLQSSAAATSGIDFLTGTPSALRMRIGGDGNILMNQKLTVAQGINVNKNFYIQTDPSSVNGYGMGVSMWSANTSAIADKYGHPGFVGRNLGWNPTTNQFRVASDNASVNWGTVTGMLVTNTFTGILGRVPTGLTAAPPAATNQYDIGNDLTSIVRLAVTTDGNVGIGTVTPTAKLDVNGNSNFTGNTTVSGTGSFGDRLTAKGSIDLLYSTTYPQPGFSWINFYGPGGTYLPEHQYFSGTYFNTGAGRLTTKCYDISNDYKSNMYFQKLDVNGINPVMQMFIQGGTGNVGIGFSPANITPSAKLHVLGTSYFTDNMVISSGTPLPFNVGGVNAKLSVKGIIVAEKLKVTLTGWPDYVFDDTYQLPSLETVEAFVKTNKHLANVPSAEEVEKNGLDVGDNNAALLRKVEELTLYLIEQNKKLKMLEEQMNALKNKK
jgi:hypothetical protein